MNSRFCKELTPAIHPDNVKAQRAHRSRRRGRPCDPTVDAAIQRVLALYRGILPKGKSAWQQFLDGMNIEDKRKRYNLRKALQIDWRRRRKTLVKQAQKTAA